MILFIPSNSSFPFSNPTVETRENGDLFIIHENGVSICNPDITSCDDFYQFGSNEKITTERLSRVSIIKFDDGCIAFINYNKLMKILKQ